MITRFELLVMVAFLLFIKLHFKKLAIENTRDLVIYIDNEGKKYDLLLHCRESGNVNYYKGHCGHMDMYESEKLIQK